MWYNVISDACRKGPTRPAKPASLLRQDSVLDNFEAYMINRIDGETMTNFVHLHNHSEFSLLDGLARTKDMVQRAAELGMPAIALTDHGTMFATIQFYRNAKAAGVKPIIGCEMYVSPRRMTDRDPNEDRRAYHLVLLAENQTGYLNLLKIASEAQLTGFYYRPRVDKEFLNEHTEGIIALSACAAGEIPRLIRDGRMEDARSAAVWYRDAFGAGNFFIELQDHEIPELREINPKLIALARELDIPMVVTNDAHYVRREDAKAHDVLLCIQTSSTVNEPNRMRMSDDGYYLKSTEEMAALFPDMPELLTNTLEIAERCNVNLDTDGYHLPRFEVPSGCGDAECYLRSLVTEGIKKRYDEITPEVSARMEHELNVIHTMGFDTYFLIVWDLCKASKERDIWWNVRGSGAASIVAYSLGITNLDPLANNLIFERFLNPGRVTMPDIDLDYPDYQRAELIQYTVERYGQEQVAQIITFGTMGARAAIRDVGRAMDIPLFEVDQIAKLVPAGPKVTIARALKEVQELRDRYENEDQVRELLEHAQSIEGVARHASTHAAGVIIADKPLVNYTPLHRPTSDSSDVQCPTTQFPMEILDSIGLLKVDFLGLATLTIMRRACDLIEEYHGVKLDLDTIPIEDETAFDLLSSGDVTGVFQVESAGMRRVLTTMKPRRFEHIVATVALYRPGPMEYIDPYIRRLHGSEEVTYKHHLLEPILGETYGIIVYQEQIIRILTDLAGYSAGEADLLRRAVGKKKKEVMMEQRDLFIAGCKKHTGIDEETADAIYSDILFFARYGFNKAHAADYAVITCQTAYLKAHYPVEYMTALLTVEQGNTEKVGTLVTECRKSGIQILAPDINMSRRGFTIEEGKNIRFGLGAIKNVGEGPVGVILQERDANGKFQDIDDFCRRVDLRQVNKRVVECMVKVGAFDQFGERHHILAVIDRMMAESARHHYALDVGQMSMFEMETGFTQETSSTLLYPLPDVPEPSRKEKLGWERELAGVFLSSHPLQRLAESLKDQSITFSGEVTDELNGQVITYAGMVVGVREITTKTNKQMAFVQMEDLQGNIEIVVFPRTYKETKHLWTPDRILLVRAKVEAREQRMALLCESVRENFRRYDIQKDDDNGILPAAEPHIAETFTMPAPMPSMVARTLHIRLNRSGDHQADMRKLKAIYRMLQSHVGTDRCVIHLVDNSQDVQIEFPNMATDYSRLEGDLRDVVDTRCLWLTNGHTA